MNDDPSQFVSIGEPGGGSCRFQTDPVAHFRIISVGQFSLTSTEALCMLLFYVQVLNQVPAESQRSKGDAVVRQSYLGFLEATSAVMFAASLTYAQTASGSVVGSIADATGDLYLTRKSLLSATFRSPKCGGLLGQISRPRIARRNPHVLCRL
jgi:hypothetical protein